MANLPQATSASAPARHVELGRAQIDVLRVLGYFYLRQGHPEKALVIFRALLALDPRDDHARRSLAFTHLAIGEFETALDLAESYVPEASEPFAAAVHVIRARALWHLGRQDEARQELRQFVELREVS